MSIQQFAKSRSLTVVKVRELCSSLLGKVPNKLSNEDIVILDNALSKTAHALLVASGDEKIDLPAEVSPVIEAIDSHTTYETVRIIGVDDLKRNVLLYLSYLKNHLLEHKFTIESLAFQTEQSFYGELSLYQKSLYEDGKARIANNCNAAFNLFSSQGLKAEIEQSKDEELAEMMQDALEYLNTVGL